MTANVPAKELRRLGIAIPENIDDDVLCLTTVTMQIECADGEARIVAKRFDVQLPGSIGPIECTIRVPPLRRAAGE